MNPKHPVFIFLPGPSLANIVPFLPQILGMGAVKATVNRFGILERTLGFRFNIVYLTSIKRLNEVLEETLLFTRRSEENLLITNTRCTRLCPRLFFEGVPSRIKVSDLGFLPQKWYNSLTGLCLVLGDMGFKNIYLFGCDGYINDLNKVYFAQGEIDPSKENFEMRKQTIEADTLQMNREFWRTFSYFNVKQKPHITNVLAGVPSAVECFPRMQIEDFLEVIGECGL
jgi:hypothetical protein